MPQITQIAPQKKKGLFNVFVDGKFAFGLDAENLVKFGLKEGLGLEETRIEQIKEEYLFTRLLNSVFNFLSYRPRSKKEVERNLDRKLYKLLGSGKETAGLPIKKRIMDKLLSLGLLNDAEFAGWLAEQRFHGSHARGPALIRWELLGKGVARETVDAVYRRLKKSDSRPFLISIIAKKDKTLKTAERPERKRKLLAALLRRGFDYEESREAVADYLKGA